MPQRPRTNFEKRVVALVRDYDEMLLAVHNKKRQASLERMLSEQAAMTLGVYWEAFIHELFVAYVTRNPVKCIADFKRRLDKNLADNFNVPATWVKVSIPQSLTDRHAERMIDPKGWNVNATSAQKLNGKATQFLHSVDALKFALSQDDAAFVDLMVAVRNYLAHRSANSRAAFKSALAALNITGGNRHLAGKYVEVGLYLKAIVVTNDRRVHTISNRLIEVARVLSP